MSTIELRKKYGITQKGISEAYGIPLDTIKSWDKNDCMPKYTYRLLELCLANNLK